jgi:hypothetical protein
LTPKAVAILSIESSVGLPLPPSILLMSGCWILALSANSVWDIFKDSLNSLTFRPSVLLRLFVARFAIGKDSDSDPGSYGNP